MGKLLIVAIFVIGAIFTVILLSTQDKAQDAPELQVNNLAEIKAKQLCREALTYGMNKISEGEVLITPNTSVLKSYSNSSFQVGDSVIDSIRYTSLTSDAQIDTIKITSYVTYNNNNEIFKHKSSAIVAWLPRDLSAAIIANGDIDVGGNALIDGDIEPNVSPPLDFEQIFGVTKETMRDSLADNHLIDPDPNPSGCSGITYVTTSTFKITTISWSGSGILVVEGDAYFNGGSFDGILWITGDLRINGNEGFSGAIFVEGYADTNVLGTASISYDPNAINNASSLISTWSGGVPSYGLELIEMYEDD